ncbi:hypothetical protein HK099_005608 [Clydaea vesicula]|uniref:Uncharacterized protein n=1 Tax=Clydaea vesicula TaxID=447962 RepID=A0AAD5TZ82_9FUNG|nr:hypothetical protein HK099_005608 [Clydaea vesicula]
MVSFTEKIRYSEFEEDIDPKNSAPSGSHINEIKQKLYGTSLIIEKKEKNKMKDTEEVGEAIDSKHMANIKNFDPIYSSNVIEVLFRSAKQKLLFLSDLLEILNKGQKGYCSGINMSNDVLECFVKADRQIQLKNGITVNEQITFEKTNYFTQFEYFNEYLRYHLEQEEKLVALFQNKFFKLLEDLKVQGNVTESEINLFKTGPLVHLSKKISQFDQHIAILEENLNVKSFNRKVKLSEKKNRFKTSPLKDLAFEDPWIIKEELNFFKTKKRTFLLEYLKFYFKIQEKFLCFEKNVLQTTKDMFKDYAQILRTVKKSIVSSNNYKPDIAIDLLCCVISVNENLEIQLMEYRHPPNAFGIFKTVRKHIIKCEQSSHVSFFEELSKFINITQENFKESNVGYSKE